jgi:hypothetical protein
MENYTPDKPTDIDAELEIKLLKKWGMNSYKIDTIISSWRHKQKYSSEYNKVRATKKQKTENGDELQSPGKSEDKSEDKSDKSEDNSPSQTTEENV